jgi:hypothetical protein
MEAVEAVALVDPTRPQTFSCETFVMLTPNQVYGEAEGDMLIIREYE